MLISVFFWTRRWSAGGDIGKDWEFSEKQFDWFPEGLPLANVWRSVAQYWALHHVSCKRLHQLQFLKPASLKGIPLESSCAESCSSISTGFSWASGSFWGSPERLNGIPSWHHVGTQCRNKVSVWKLKIYDWRIEAACLQKAGKMVSVFLTLFNRPQQRYMCVQELLASHLWDVPLRKKTQPLQVHSMFYEMSIHSFIDHR